MTSSSDFNPVSRRRWVNRAELLFWLKVYPRGDCWERRGARDSRGYGKYRWSLGGSGAKNHWFTPQYVHRHAAELAIGPILPGEEVDHLCLHKWCVRPSHLDIVSRKINNDRRVSHLVPRTHCRRGHEITGTNAKPQGGGERPTCRICSQNNWNAWWRRNRGKK